MASYGLFQRIETEQQQARHNMGVEMLEHLGVIQGMNYDRLIDAILALTIPEEAVEGE